MVPEETRQQVTDSLQKSQSKSDITQQDSPLMVCDSPMMPPSPNEDVSSRIPEISQPCVSLAQAASTELPLNVEDEDNRTSHDFDAILGQVIPEELAFRFLDPSSASSHQNAQGTWASPYSSSLRLNITTAADSGPQVEHWASRTAPLGVGVQPPTPNISYDGPTVNASADTSLPNNPMGQNPHIRLPSFCDIYDYQLEMLNKEQGYLQKKFEETTSELKDELDKKMAEIQREYDRKSQEVDSEYINQAMKEEVYRSSVVMSSLLSNGFMSKCTDRSVATGIASVRAAGSSQPSTQQQQTVQRNTHMNLTASPQSCITVEAPIPNASGPIPDLSGPLSHSLHYNTTQPRPISHQATVQSNTPVNSTTLPQPSVTSVEPRPLHSARSITPQPRPISQQATVQSNTPMNSTVLPQPSVTSVEPRPLHSARSITPQPRPISQQATVQSNTPMNSTVLPQPSVTSVEPRPLQSPRSITPQPRPISQQGTVQSNTPMNSTVLPQPSVTSVEPRPLHSARSITPQPRPISQQATVQSNTPMNSTVLPQPSVTSVEPRPLHSARSITPQPRPISQQATVQSNTPMNSTVLPQPSVTSVEPRPLQSPRSITPQPRPISQQATVQSNTPMNSTVLPQPSVTSVEPRPLHSARSITPQPRPISQQAMVRSNRHANSTALSRPSITSEALNNTLQSRAPPLIPNHTPSSYSAAFTPPVQGGVRTMPPHLRSSRAPNFASASASTTNRAPNSAATAASTTNPTSLVQEQQQQQENSNGGLVYLSDDEE